MYWEGITAGSLIGVGTVAVIGVGLRTGSIWAIALYIPLIAVALVLLRFTLLWRLFAMARLPWMAQYLFMAAFGSERFTILIEESILALDLLTRYFPRYLHRHCQQPLELSKLANRCYDDKLKRKFGAALPALVTVLAQEPKTLGVCIASLRELVVGTVMLNYHPELLRGLCRILPGLDRRAGGVRQALVTRIFDRNRELRDTDLAAEILRVCYRQEAPEEICALLQGGLFPTRTLWQVLAQQRLPGVAPQLLRWWEAQPHSPWEDAVLPLFFRALWCQDPNLLVDYSLRHLPRKTDKLRLFVQPSPLPLLRELLQEHGTAGVAAERIEQIVQLYVTSPEWIAAEDLGELRRIMERISPESIQLKAILTSGVVA